jgi:signal transduction histidine kinase
MCEAKDAAGSLLIDLARRVAHIRGGPLPGRLGVGVLSAIVGAIALHAIGKPMDDCHAYAAFYPIVQIAGLAGGLAAAGVAALASTLIVLFSAEPFAEFWTSAALLLANATLAGLAGESLRKASERSAPESRRTAGPQAATTRSFESVTATIAHDIAQPLAAAAAYLQTVRRLLASEPGARGSSIAAAVDKATAQLARAGRLVTRMREFLAYGPPRLAAVPAHALLLEAIGPHRDDGPLLRLDARCDRVLADPAQLEQLFVELVRAATTAPRPAEGRPAIATSSDGSALIVTVALGELDADAPEGRTADLSLWRATVEAHRGAFRTEPAEQGGLTIEFTLPLAARGG